MRNSRLLGLKPVMCGFAIPVLVALFVSIMARVPQPMSSNDLTPMESTSKSTTEFLRAATEKFDREYLTSIPAGDAYRYTQMLIAESQDTAANPFIYPKARSVTNTSEPEEVESVPKTVETPVFRLSAVMGGRRPIAAINGNLFRKGQEVSPGWKIKIINSAEQSVIVEGPDGAEILLTTE